ncbi:uncharacterized protein ColSpa_11433 [Colletotrichum spaethianum]|uniref:Uncharacterized protein n=1 Tax=Colletotrichum spaethianum TaxID=700344 RepID=A0AA37PFK6_9PEZI|nr:uncharacterized protein ColSpa_11433 [Colletotrichum spaethianum]GKT51252.1 hypothetical protein ColSpa_11433 [Colletotrichum spaethianum]
MACHPHNVRASTEYDVPAMLACERSGFLVGPWDVGDTWVIGKVSSVPSASAILSHSQYQQQQQQA